MQKVMTNKRKRDSNSMWPMLNWVLEVAKDPCNPVLGSLPEVSKWDSFGSEQLRKKVLLLRQLMTVTKENSPSHKRKGDSMRPMLNWVSKVAKDPCNPVLGSVPEVSKWNSFGIEQLWKKVLLTRQLSFDQSSTANHFNSQKSQKMHPSMYVDKHISGYNLRERASGSKIHSMTMTPEGQDYSESSEIHSDSDTFMDGPRTEPRIGPNFQADVPEWTGVACESDPKWLGTCTSPLDNEGEKPSD